MGSERTTLGKAYGTKWGAIGNMFKNTLGAWVTYWELDGNTLGTKNSKNLNTSLPFTRGKKMNILGVSAIHHWLSKIFIINCVHNLFWPRVMVRA
jgi:hypothetical protein